MEHLSCLFNSIQNWLLPDLEEELGELSSKQIEFIKVVELLRPDMFLDNLNWCGIGRKPSSRLSLIKAFIAKPIFRIADTMSLIDFIKSNPSLRRLCGWESYNEVPSEATFSRAFKLFSEFKIAQKIHENSICRNIGEKLFGHKSTDATSIKGREKPCRKNTPTKKKKGKPGRPKKGEEKPKEPKRVELQLERNLDANLEDLPKGCDWGSKKGSNGKVYKWKGYKLHLDCVDGDIPVSAVVTSASLHDSQVAIPLSQMSEKRIINLYDLMDAAYDSPEIHLYSKQNNRIPIIDNNPRRGGIKKKMDPAKSARYNERSSAERVNSELKDNYGVENIRVKGQLKVECHIFFAIIALAAKKIFKLIP